MEAKKQILGIGTKGASPSGSDPWSILKWAHLAEKSMSIVERENKIVFMVDRKANKKEIAKAFEAAFDVKVIGVTTHICPKGKKAYIKLGPEYSASDIATKLGMV